MSTIASARSTPSSLRTQRVMKIVGWSVMALLAGLITLYAARYLTLDPAVYLENQRAVYVANAAALTLHVGGAMAALLIGPFQFLPRSITRRCERVHRTLGRISLVGVRLGGLGGLYHAVPALGGVGR